MSENETIKILSIDAWADGEEGWTWNDMHQIGTLAPEDAARFYNDAGEVDEQAVLDYMKAEGMLRDSVTLADVAFDGGYYDAFFLEVQERETGRPLYAFSAAH